MSTSAYNWYSSLGAWKSINSIFVLEDFEEPNIPENQMVTFVNLAWVQRNGDIQD